MDQKITRATRTLIKYISLSGLRFRQFLEILSDTNFNIAL